MVDGAEEESSGKYFTTTHSINNDDEGENFILINSINCQRTIYGRIFQHKHAEKLQQIGRD